MGGATLMQRYIKNDSSEIRYFEDDVNVGGWIDLNEYRLMTDDEIDRHENPEKYLSDEEKAQFNRKNMPTLTPIEFDIKLNNAGLYDTVQELIKDKFELRIAYNRATFFSRTDPFIDQARIALNLTDEQVDNMWEKPLALYFIISE